jgi:hypothetical protein
MVANASTIKEFINSYFCSEFSDILIKKIFSDFNESTFFTFYCILYMLSTYVLLILA